MKKAEHYWRVLLLTNPPSDWYWQSATSYLAKHAKRNKQKAGSWRGNFVFLGACGSRRSLKVSSNSGPYRVCCWHLKRWRRLDATTEP